MKFFKRIYESLINSSDKINEVDVWKGDQSDGGGEAGIHIHNLDRANSSTLLDGQHSHLFEMADGNFIVTENDGAHSHPLLSPAADLIFLSDGEHSHLITLPNGETVKTSESVSRHAHELQVDTTAWDGVHVHLLNTEDGEITSLRPGEFWSKFGMSEAEALNKLTHEEEKLYKATNLGSPTRFITLGASNNKSLLILSDQNFLIDPHEDLTAEDVRKFGGKIRAIFLTKSSGDLFKAQALADELRSGLIIPVDEREIQTVSKTIKFFVKKVGDNWGYQMDTAAGSAVWVPNFKRFPKWITKGTNLAFLAGGEDTLKKATELEISQVILIDKLVDQQEFIIKEETLDIEIDFDVCNLDAGGKAALAALGYIVTQEVEDTTPEPERVHDVRQTRSSLRFPHWATL